jgi:hypothetical protein
VRERLNKRFPPKPASLKNAETFLSDAGYAKNRLAGANIFSLIFSAPVQRDTGRVSPVLKGDGHYLSSKIGLKP